MHHVANGQIMIHQIRGISNRDEGRKFTEEITAQDIPKIFDGAEKVRKLSVEGVVLQPLDGVTCAALDLGGMRPVIVFEERL